MGPLLQICKRNYVTVDESARSLVPTKLGILLAHGYHRIDPELVLPKVPRLPALSLVSGRRSPSVYMYGYMCVCAPGPWSH